VQYYRTMAENRNTYVEKCKENAKELNEESA
jgi:hypothetical protein